MATVSNLDQLFVQGAIEGFVDLVMPITSFSYAVDVNGASLNDAIRVPFVANASGSSAFTYAAGYSGTSNGVTGKDILLSNLLYQPVSLTDADFAKITPEVVTRLGKQAGARLAADVISASFASVVTAGNYPNSASYTSTAFTSSVALADLDNKANIYKWADGERTLIAGTTLWNSLMNNSGVTQAYAFGGSEAIRNGTIPSVFGFKPYKTTVTLPNSDTGFACSTNALLFGMAYHQPKGESNGIVNAIKATDEKTGLVIGLRSFYDPYKATTVKVIEALFGVAKGADNGLIHIK